MRSKRSSAMRFLLCSSVVLTASAAVIRTPLERRVEDCLIDTSNSMEDDPDRLNTDGTAGIGAEFESPEFALVSAQCSDDDTNDAKRKVIAGRTGTNWELTADSIGKKGKLQAEYIIDGVKVKVGSTEDATNGAKVAADLAQNLVDWKPWASDDTRNVDIADNNCNPWKITTRPSRDPNEVSFQPQITTPMPLEALYSLMKEQAANPLEKNVLDGTNYRFPEGLKLVAQQHFQSNPSGIDKTKVTDDVLAFCTLVLSYGKGALSTLQPGQSPKLFTTFMPRTNFNKIFAQVSSKLPAKGDDLWALFNNLACYKGDGNQVDTDLCTGDVASPTPIDNKFGDLTFAQGDKKCNIHDWIHGLDQDSQDDDDLTKFDEAIDGSIGNLHAAQEKMFNSQRSVPLFEFRDLDTLRTKEMEDFMSKVDKAIQDLHNNFANPPGKKAKRQDSACAPPDPEPTPEPTPTGPTKQLAVVAAFVPGAPTMDWLFLTADYEKGVECREDFLRPVDTVPWDTSGTTAEDGSTFPGGTRDLDLEIDGQKCQYKNDGDDPGALWCGERIIGCKDDPADKDPNDSSSDKGNYQCGDYTRQPVFVCPY
ncbi:hypothetical protein BDV96DRAFT_649034 [Lophiotrema nucula]|uniref:Uncharacterized protein n=1 Tax=Lophiotrema nucula TaxID=690887 RepID=A0A6A5Z3B0_9PLEO|nr:hypothetical protein BDV96DRAFT_649034 [Lophiotrema nucula]